jgi:hypothetical protein
MWGQLTVHQSVAQNMLLEEAIMHCFILCLSYFRHRGPTYPRSPTCCHPDQAAACAERAEAKGW